MEGNGILKIEHKTMISLKDCRNGYLYIIAARNAYVGIFNAKKKGFRISRFKFDRNYESVEYHWDTGEPHGTVRPYRKLFKPTKIKEECVFLSFINKYFENNQEEILTVIKEEDEELGRLLKAEDKLKLDSFNC
jgi:hypothetical protein